MVMGPGNDDGNDDGPCSQLNSHGHNIWYDGQNTQENAGFVEVIKSK
jgi:hypothetical protein